MDIQTDQVQVQGDLAIDAYLAMPQGEGPFSGVVVIQEIFGVNDHIRDITRRLAKAGHVAIAPAIYQRQTPGFESGYTEADLKIGREYKNQTKASELIGDIQAAIDYLYKLPPVKQTGVGCIGFCFGGHVAYLAATLNAVKATASFYGAGITTGTPGNGEPTLARTGEISGTLYGFFGLEDDLIPNEQVDEIEAALKQHEINHRIFRYPGAGHGFMCDQRASYHANASQDAWQQVLELFRSSLASS